MKGAIQNISSTSHALTQLSENNGSFTRFVVSKFRLTTVMVYQKFAFIPLGLFHFPYTFGRSYLLTDNAKLFEYK